MTRRLPRRIAGLLLAALGGAAAAGAQSFSGLEDPIVTDRPDFTESTEVVPRGHFQIEGGSTWARVEDEESESLGEILVRIGAGERWEARIGAGSFTRSQGDAGGASGFEDPSIGIKIRLSPEDNLIPPDRPSIALILLTSVPEGGEEVSDGTWIPEAKLGFAWELTPRFSAGSNLNYAYATDEDEDERFHQISASVTTGFAWTDRIGSFLEYYGFSKESLDGDTTHYFDTGVTFLISNDLQLDVRIGRGFNEADPDYFAGAGASLRW